MNKYIVVDICKYCDVSAEKILRKHINDESPIIYDHPKWGKLSENELQLLGYKEYDEYVAYSGDFENCNKYKHHRKSVKYATLGGHIRVANEIIGNKTVTLDDFNLENKKFSEFITYYSSYNGTCNVIQYIHNIADEHERNKAIQSGLCAASENCNIDIFEQLLNLHTGKMSIRKIHKLFDAACFGGSSYIIRKIIEKYIDANDNILTDMVILMNTDIIPTNNIGENGMRIIELQLQGACKKGNIELVSNVLPQIKTDTKLLNKLINISLKNNKVEIADLLLNERMKTVDNNSLLYGYDSTYVSGLGGYLHVNRAVTSNSAPLLQLLCNYFSDNILDGIVNNCDEEIYNVHSNSVLCFVVSKCNKKLMKILSEHISCAHLLMIYYATDNNEQLVKWLWTLDNIAKIDNTTCGETILYNLLRDSANTDIFFNIIKRSGVSKRDFINIVSNAIGILDQTHENDSDITHDIAISLINCLFDNKQ